MCGVKPLRFPYAPTRSCRNVSTVMSSTFAPRKAPGLASVRSVERPHAAPATMAITPQTRHAPEHVTTRLILPELRPARPATHNSSCLAYLTT